MAPIRVPTCTPIPPHICPATTHALGRPRRCVVLTCVSVPLAQERVPRAVRHPGEPELRLAAPRATAAVVVQGALSGGGEDPRPVAGRRRQVPAAQEVPAAQDHMGRRGDRVLF